MTTTPSLDRLSLRSPDALIASLPYLLGFVPSASAVLIWMAEGRILLTQRLDLPRDPAHLEPWHAAVWAHVAVREADELVLVLVADEESMLLLDIAAKIGDRADAEGIEVRDILRVDGDRWWSLLCEDRSCCPSEGRLLEQSVRDAVAAEFTLIGCAPLPERADLVRLVERDDALCASVARAITEAVHPDDREAWRDERIAALVGRLAEPATGSDEPAALAQALEALADIRVRDTVLWEVSRWDEERLGSAYAGLCQLLRAAPDGAVAPAATCAAIVSWQLGDGARAVVALDRAGRDDPEYALALLVGASLGGGLPPAAWREAMAGLSRETCRHGSS